MCLNRITDRNPKSDGEGYVVVKNRNKKLYGAFYGGRRLTGRWLNERDFRGNGGFQLSGPDNYIKGGMGDNYSKGFHIHLSKKGARSFLWNEQYLGFSVIRKVKYRKSVVVGRQMAVRGFIVVAKEMYIYLGKAE